MKKSLLFLFLLVLGVTQGWAVDYLTLPAGGGELVDGAIYRVESNTTINSTLSVPTDGDGTVTIYIAKGKTLTVRGTNGAVSTNNNASGASKPAKPAIEVPSGTTLIITGAGTLRVYGGRAATYATNAIANGGAAGAAPAIGGAGGFSSQTRGEAGANGNPMGTVYVRGNVIVRAARGTSRGRRATTAHGADGCVPTYAIGAGGGGGAARKTDKGVGGVNGTSGDKAAQGNLYIEKSARVVYLNGRRDTRNRTVASFKTPTKLNVKYIVDGTLKTTQVLKEFGTLNVNNKAYSVTTEDETLNDDGFTTVTVKNVKSWNTKEDGSGDTYNTKDLLVYNNVDRTGASVDFPLYAQWDENSGVQFNGIHDAYELTQFAKVVNAGKADANGILLADINMAESAWNEKNPSRVKGDDGEFIKWGKWENWVPIGTSMREKFENEGKVDTENYDAKTYTKPFSGIFDGNGHIVSDITMDQTLTGHDAYSRAGLFGYAKSATIKNVVVKNATLRAKWQMAAVCGRLDGGTIENCGSFGNFGYSFENNADLPGSRNAQAAAGVVVTDGVSNANAPSSTVNSVWSTYDQYANANNNNVKYNQVVGDWNYNYNDDYNNYTQNGGSGTTKKSWIYVAEANKSWLTNGKLCHDLNGNVDGATAWTQTFNEEDKADATRDYVECPRPTSEGLPVYKDGENVYSNHIYTISFESNGGTDCDDAYIVRKYNEENLTYPSLPKSARDGREFVGWFDADSENANKVTSANSISSDITLYAQWNQTMIISGNIDPKENDYYYSTFYYSDQAFEIQTSNAYAYKAKRLGDGTTLKMESIKAAAGGKVVIPAGEAVIIRSKDQTVELKAVDSEADFDVDNILYGSDEEVPVEDVIDQIPDADTDDKTYSNCYIFSGNKTNGVGFYKPNSTELKPHKAFVLLDGQIDKNFSSTEAKSLNMLFDDDMDEEEATGISEYKSETETKKAIFSINGMPLSKLQKGINIVGGKKVFVK